MPLSVTTLCRICSAAMGGAVANDDIHTDSNNNRLGRAATKHIACPAASKAALDNMTLSLPETRAEGEVNTPSPGDDFVRKTMMQR